MHQPIDQRWRDEATCREVDAELFFPEVGENATAARRICATCPVRTACLNDALARRDVAYGVRGGMTPSERRELLGEEGRAA